MKKGIYPISSFVKLHTKNLKTPKMTRRKLEILKLQNTKTKNFQKERQISPFSPLMKLHTMFFEDPQNYKKKN